LISSFILFYASKQDNDCFFFRFNFVNLRIISFYTILLNAEELSFDWFDSFDSLLLKLNTNNSFDKSSFNASYFFILYCYKYWTNFGLWANIVFTIFYIYIRLFCPDVSLVVASLFYVYLCFYEPVFRLRHSVRILISSYWFYFLDKELWLSYKKFWDTTLLRFYDWFYFAIFFYFISLFIFYWTELLYIVCIFQLLILLSLFINS
jgi:hypothetical protein